MHTGSATISSGKSAADPGATGTYKARRSSTEDIQLNSEAAGMDAPENVHSEDSEQASKRARFASDTPGSHENPAYEQDGEEDDANANGNGNVETYGRGDADNTSEVSVTPSEELEELEAPVWLCKMIATYPKRMFGLFLAMHMLGLALLILLTAAGYDAVPIDFENAPFYLRTDWTHLRTMAWIYRDDSDIVLPNVLDVEDVANQTVKEEGYVAYYDAGDKNVFTQENLIAIKEAEGNIVATKKYDQFCHADSGGTCVPPISILRFFDGTFNFLNSTVFVDNPDFENIPGVLEAAFDYPLTKAVIQFHLGKDYEINATTGVAYSSVTRTLFRIGFPLAGYTSPNEDEDEQESEREDFLGGEMTDKFIDIAGDGVGDMDFLYNSVTILQAAITRTVVRDLALAFGSMAFIFIFVCFQTRSLFITGLAVGSILTSFCWTNLVYRILFDMRYFGIFHVLSIFIILGIGADNIFVFHDTWRHTSFKKYPSLEYRLSDCYRRSASAMLITSLTTTIAFFANAVSPLLMISSFGLFSGLLIIINYLSVITYFPCVIVMYHLYFEKWTWPCCRCCGKKAKEKTEDVTEAPPASTVTHGDRVMTVNAGQAYRQRRSSSITFSWDPETQTIAKSQNEKGEKPNVVVRFFAGPYFKFVTHKIIRIFIVIFFLAVIAFFFYQSSKLEASKEALKIFKDSHNFGRAVKLNVDDFVPSAEDDNVKVYISFGLGEQDRGECHKTDFGCEGETVWEKSLDLNPTPAQLSLLNFCQQLRTLPQDDLDRLRIRKNVQGEVEIKCFMENMEDYLHQAMKDLNITDDFHFPATPTKVRRLMEARPDLYNMSLVDDHYYRYFEVALDYWLADGFKGRSYEYDQFYELIGMANDTRNTHSMTIDGLQYLYGTRLIYVAIMVNTTLKYRGTGYEEGLPILDDWEDFINDAVEAMPPSISSGVQFTPDLLDPDEWQWLKIQEILVISAWTGIGIGLCFALPIFILATRNWILGLMATVTITIITFTIVGMINLLGWKLGALESINMSLVVGLAVDYVVHLVEGYNFSTKKDRLGRTHDMLSEVGVSVVSGACTTLGASFFMLFTVLMFFTQFGIFIFCTIGFSLFYSLGFFSTMLGIMGPEGDTGSIMPLYYWFKRLVTGRRKTDVDCTVCQGKGFYGRRKSERLMSIY